MSDESEGWVKSWRSKLTDGLWQMLSDGQYRALDGFLLQVNWRPSEFGCRNCKQTIRLPAGGTAKSCKTLAEDSHVSEKIMKATVRLLVRKGFLINESRSRCHSAYIVKNWEKYQGGEMTGAQGGTQSGTQSGPWSGTQSGPCEEEVKKERSKETTETFLTELPGTNPLVHYVEVADQFHRWMAGSGSTMRGWKTAKAFARNQRKRLAQTIQRVEADLEIDRARQLKILEWAIIKAPPFTVGGEDWTWRRVLDCGDPAAKWASKAVSISDAFDRASIKPTEKPYSAGPGYCPHLTPEEWEL